MNEEIKKQLKIFGFMFLLGLLILGGLSVFNNNSKEVVINQTNIGGTTIVSDLNRGQLQFNNVTLIDSTIYDTQKNICSAGKYGMNITISPCTVNALPQEQKVQYVNFSWTGAPKNISWIFVYDGVLKSGSMKLLRNISYQDTISTTVNQQITNFVVDKIINYTNLGTPNATTPSCTFGNKNNTQEYLVTRNGNVGEYWCFTTVTAINSTAFKVSGNADLTTQSQVQKSKIDFDDVTNSVQFLGVGLLNDNRSYYKVQDVLFNTGQSYYTKWTYMPQAQASSGKWHILGYDSAVGLITSVQNNQYLYIDPFWNSTWTYCQNMTVAGSPSTQTNFTFYANVSYNAHFGFTDMRDVRFVNASCSNGGTAMNYERDYNISGNSAGYWITTPTMTTGNNVYSMYYGNPTATDGSNPSATWLGTNAKVVLHFSEGTGSNLFDSTGLNNNGTIGATGGTWYNSIYGKGFKITASSQQYFVVNASTSLDNVQVQTVSLYANISAFGTLWRKDGSYLIDNSGSPNRYYTWGEGNLLNFNNNIHANQYEGFYATHSPTSKVVYFNNTAVASVNPSGNIAVTTKPIMTCDNSGGCTTYFTTAIYDEFRIYNESKSADWVTRDNQNANFSTTLFGAEVTGTVADSTYPIFSNYADNNGTQTGSGLAVFNVTVLNTNGTVFLEINGLNRTANNISLNLYNFSLTLTNATYSYKWIAYGNGTSNLLNTSASRSYTVNNLVDNTYPIFANELIIPQNNSAYILNNNYTFSINSILSNGTIGIEFNGLNYSMQNQSFIGLCYQETANASTLGDGSCGLNYSGKYLDYNPVGEALTSPNLFIDGNFSTSTSYGGGDFGAEGMFFINYTKPLNSISAIWRVKDNNDYNLTIPQSCYNYNQNKILLQIEYIASGGLGPDNSGHVKYDCFDGGWIVLLDIASNPPLYEEGIYWNFGSYVKTLNDLRTGTYPYYYWAYGNGTSKNFNRTIINYYTVQKAIGNISTYLNNTRSNINLKVGDSILLNSTLKSGVGAINLFNNGALINSGNSPLSNLTTFSSSGTFIILSNYSGNENFTSASESFNVIVNDVSAPILNITSLPNRTTLSLPSNLTLTSSASDPNLDKCYYNTNDNPTNITFTCNTVKVITFNSGGTKTVNVFANDTFGNTATVSATANLYFMNVSQTATSSPLSEGQSDTLTLLLNQSGLAIGTAEANLYWNGTSYGYDTKTVIDANTILFTRTFAVSTGLGSPTGNPVSYYWIWNSTQFPTNTQTATQTQSIISVSLANCSGASTQILGLSLKDEISNTLVSLSNITNIQINLMLTSTTNLTQGFQYNLTYANQNYLPVCVPSGLLNNTNYTIDFTVGFSSANHVFEYYYLDNGLLTSNTTAFNSMTLSNISLMDLDTADSTTFLFKFTDAYGLPVKSGIVHVFREYIGDGIFREVERARMDDNGQTHLHLTEEDAIYYFVISNKGVPQFTSGQYNAKCLSTPCTIELSASGNVVGLPPIQDIFNGITFSSNRSTRSVILSYSYPDVTTVNMTLYRSGASVTVINSTVLTASSGTLSTVIPLTYGNETFFVSIYKNNQFVGIKWIDFKPTGQDYFGIFGAILGGMVILALVLITLGEGGVITVIGIIIGLIAIGLMMLVELSWLALISIICAGGVIIWAFIRRGK